MIEKWTDGRTCRHTNMQTKLQTNMHTRKHEVKHAGKHADTKHEDTHMYTYVVRQDEWNLVDVVGTRLQPLWAKLNEGTGLRNVVKDVEV